MTGAAILWGLAGRRPVRIALFALVTVVLAMTTPLVREAAALSAWPDAIEAYVRPLPGRSNFALFPWAAFVFGGAVAGELVSASRTREQERWLQRGLLAAGLAGIGLGYAASFRPSIYPVANFWTSSPTFFFIRLGICAAMVPVARAVDWFHGVVRARVRDLPPGAPGLVITTLGRSSLFVYWIHVEMVYGGLARPLKRALPLEVSLAATVGLCALLYAITRWKDRKMREVELSGPFRIFAPVLK